MQRQWDDAAGEPNTDPDATRTQTHVPDTPVETPAFSAAMSAVAGYEIHGILGRGGMGVVYHARQLRANRDVALKMILAGTHAAAGEVARFRVEAEAVAGINHPNIVAVFEVGEHEGRPFFSMEYCPSGSLAERLRGRAMPPREAAALVLKLARAMAATHAAGIVHRDLKPHNILLTSDGEPKISDFGLAKHFDRGTLDAGLTQSGAILGTPSYMAPEQALGASKRVGPAADVYALGAILYELLVGTPPFVGPSTMDTVLQVISDEPVRPRTRRAEVPRALEAICLKCLEKSPTRRYPTAHELADELARFLQGESISAGQHHLVGRLASALDRVPLHDRFARYGSLLLALVPVMFLPELWITFVVWNDGHGSLLGMAQFGRVALFIAVLGGFRGWRWLPDGAAERELWTIWGGYLLCCFVVGLGTRLALGLWETEVELQIYIPIAALTALAFFALASSFWGYCAVIGLAFLGLVFVMAIDLRFAPLEFGTLWTLVLFSLGLRLRSLHRQSAAGNAANTPARRHG